jgi:hypothetical protein
MFIVIQIYSFSFFGIHWIFPFLYHSLLVFVVTLSVDGDPNDVLYLYPKEIWAYWGG